jgi:tetraacyldisaccharide 4'-kinase
LLREPRSGLRRAHVVVLTRCNQVEEALVQRLRTEIDRLAPQALVVESQHRPTGWINAAGEFVSLESGFSECVAFCGIGNPDAFRRTLDDLGMKVIAFRTFPDHHNYTRTDVEELHAWARGHGCPLAVTTQKDLVKLQIDRLGPCGLWALRIDLHLQAGRDRFEERLRDVLRNTGPKPTGRSVRPAGQPVCHGLMTTDS